MSRNAFPEGPATSPSKPGSRGKMTKTRKTFFSLIITKKESKLKSSQFNLNVINSLMRSNDSLVQALSDLVFDN